MGSFKFISSEIVVMACCVMISSCAMADFALRQCEPIKIEMCRNIGYNETSMPNLVGNELQSEAEYTLQTFSPLIEYVCSSQLKLFLCATYVPMCTPKVPLPIGPCRTLCESVRSRCHPVLQGFGYPWPPALDCNRFPKENNHEAMCMEGPGETPETSAVNEMYPAYPAAKAPFQPTTISNVFECPGHSKLYIKLHRTGRCAPLCEANILFGPNEKHIAELWTHTWTYASVVVALLATICLLCHKTKSPKVQDRNQSRVLKPLMWSHTFVAIGWTVRFIVGRTATSCGFDPQLPNVSLLLVDGLSNGSCASTFILRYYFGMAACAWWAILCLGWHRNVRSVSPDELGHMSLNTNVYSTLNVNSGSNGPAKLSRPNVSKAEKSITSNNLARFLAWGLPAFQTAAVIVARLVDADELLGACYVGNQSDKGLQILVATPLFCYWIFGSMNLASGYLVYRRNKDILRNTNSASIKLLMQSKCTISGIFLFIYCLPYALLLLAVIYEFANIDVWLNESPYNQAPVWPFLTRAFMELLLGIICSISILGPKISSLYKRQLSAPPAKTQPLTIQVVPKFEEQKPSRVSTKSYSNASYQSVKEHKHSATHSKKHGAYKMSLNQMPNYSSSRSKLSQGHSHLKMNALPPTCSNNANAFHRYGDETIL